LPWPASRRPIVWPSASVGAPVVTFLDSLARLNVRLPTLRRQPAYERDAEAGPEQARACRPVGTTAVAVAAAMGALRTTVGWTAMWAATMSPWRTSLAAAMNQIAASRHAFSATQDAALHVIYTRAAGHRVARAVRAAVSETECCASALRQSILPAEAFARLDAVRRTEFERCGYACARRDMRAAHVVRHVCPVDGSFRVKPWHVHCCSSQR
jgi:hypothetical protein